MSVGDVLVGAYELERVVFRIALVVLVGKLVSEAFAALHPRRSPPPSARGESVTVQIPIRNERHVAERAIRAIARLDHPRDRLEIQVLDDSDDDTTDIIDRVVEELARDGVAIAVVRRADRAGAKAGALANGLSRARGDYIAVFDADCVPDADFLQRVLPAFDADARAGMVQGRWTFANRTASLLTRVAAMLLDGLMLVEQPAKDARARPLHSNGTAGVWRRACIVDAGGWRGVSITEDLELSYRAVRRGWRMVHLADVTVATELPRTMRAFRSQQQRWTRGNAQVLRDSWSAIAKSALPVGARLAMLARASMRLLYVFLAVLTVGMPITTFVGVRWLVNYGPAIDGAMFAVVLAAVCVFYVPAHARATGSTWRGIALVPCVIAIHVGLSLCCAVSFVAGLVVRDATFVRTPKFGDGPAGRDYALPLSAFAIVELAIGVAYGAFTALAVARGLPAVAAFFAFWSVAHLWTGGASLTAR